MPLAGQRIRALDFTAAVQAESAVMQANVGTTYVAGSPEVGVVFTAPTSGKVLVTISGLLQDDGGTTAVILDWELYEGASAAGTKVSDTGLWEHRLELRGISTGYGQNASKTTLHAGLTAGTVYYVRTMHRALTGSTADVVMRAVNVVPLPA